MTRPTVRRCGAPPAAAMSNTPRRAALRSPRGGTVESRRGARGVMLLEVLITVLIFSIGLLGLVALQTRAYQYAMSAEDTNRAALLANEIGSAMWGNQSATLPEATYTTWQARVADPAIDGLPNGVGTVTTVGNLATVTIAWRPPTAAAGTPANRFVTQVLVP